VLWTHNDSGDEPRVFAVRAADGADLGAFTFAGAEAVDWEDIALGPCAPGSTADCLYLGDIGDNFRTRSASQVYRIPEPTPLPAGGAATITGVARLDFRYPDGPHDAEALLVDPASARVYVITKEKSGPSTVFRLPAPFPATATARAPLKAKAVSMLAVAALGQLVTGADVSPDGRRVLVRTYDMAFELTIAPGAKFESAFLSLPCVFPVDRDGQGESIAYIPDGTGFWTTREAEPAPLYVSSCR
jgi:hypothetical protein